MANVWNEIKSVNLPLDVIGFHCDVCWRKEGRTASEWKGKKGKERKRAALAYHAPFSWMSTRYAKSLSRQRDVSLHLYLHLHVSSDPSSAFPRRFMKTKTKVTGKLGTPKNALMQKIESNGRKTSNQTDPHEIVKILKFTLFQVWQVLLNLKFCNLIHNSEYILSIS